MRKVLLIKENNRGITLIALIITIIVLLILAAVSISTLTGENGILDKASQANEQTETKDIQERTELAYLGALMNGDGKITTNNLTDELNKLFGESNYTITGSGPWVIKEKDSKKYFKILSDGKVEEVNIISFTIRGNSNYGKVKCTALEGMDWSTWLNLQFDDEEYVTSGGLTIKLKESDSEIFINIKKGNLLYEYQGFLYNSRDVNLTDIIQPNGEYIFLCMPFDMP